MAVIFFSEQQTVHELLCLGFVVQLEGEPGMVVFWNGGLSSGICEAYTLSVAEHRQRPCTARVRNVVVRHCQLFCEA